MTAPETRPEAATVATLGGPLEVRVGNAPGWSFRIKHLASGVLDHEAGHVWSGTLTDWRTIAVCASHEGQVATWVIEPAKEGDPLDEIAFGGFYVRGRFRKASFFNGQKRAALAYKAFVAT